jgi:hypothetical protein
VIGSSSRVWSLAIFAVVVGCSKDDTVDTDVEPVLAPPELACEFPAETVEGTAIPISCAAVDPDGVYAVTMYYRSGGVLTWRTAQLSRSDTDETVFTGEVPAAEVAAPDVAFYFKATDSASPRSTGYLPERGQDEPYVVPVAILARPLPFFEDFEGAAGKRIYDLGWDEQADSFEGYTWATQEGRASSGDIAVAHRRGLEGLDPLADWLITPALDFSTVPSAQVTWREFGDFADLGAHSLWIGTSPTPGDGAWTKLLDLPNAPEDAWGRAQVIDLSAYVGQSPVWVAWRYEGQYADDWYLDDVSVRTLSVDLWQTDFSWTPDPVSPGASATVTFDLENRTPVAGAGLTGRWIVDPADGVVDSETFTVDIDASGAFTLSADVALSPDVLDNSYVPVALELSDGVDTWRFDERMVVGVPTTATIDVSTDDYGLIQATLGVGDPDAPDYEASFESGIVDAGDYTWTVDLTGLPDHLGPGPGADRWWVRIESAASGKLHAFDIDYDGSSYVSDDTGRFEPGGSALFYLPRPPEPKLISSGTSPTRVAPGDTITYTVTLQNAGAATVGATSVTLSSTDPDVTILSADPVSLAASGWAAGASASASFSFSVADTHVDSTPVDLTLTVTDEAESFTVPASVSVPWPLLKVTGVRVDDWETGDDDGLLDPGETATLQVDLTNMGGLDAFGPVKCTLSQTGGTGTASVRTASASFGLVVAGSTKTDKNLEVSVVGGAVGDSLEMLLSCSDGKQSYDPAFVIVVGEPSWLVIGTTNDATGDNLSSYGFDFVNGRYRSDGATLDIELDSAVPFDFSTVFIEAWMTSVGGDYQYYQLVVQSGVAKLRGYDLGVWTTLPTPTATAVDDDTLAVGLDLTGMGLSLDKIDVGFAAGFCGGDPYYCDQFADGWGNPYVTGFDETRFFELSW